jgi:hypothetical protein
VSRRFVSEHADQYPVSRLCALSTSPGPASTSGASGPRPNATSTTPCSVTRSSRSTGRHAGPTGPRGSMVSSATAVGGWVANGSLG